MKTICSIVMTALLMCVLGGNAWAAQKDINIAFMCELTGAGSFFGKVQKDVGKDIVNEINKAGIKGFGKMQIRVYDIASDPAITARKVERAVSEGANVIWGGFVSSCEKMMVAKGEELKIPTILTNETTVDSFHCDTRYAITPTLSTFEYGKINAKYFKQQNVKTYAVIGADYIFGRTWDRSLSYHLQGSGIKKVYENWHGFKKVDYAADIAQLKRLKPDAVVRTYGGAGDFVIVKQMKDAGFWPKEYIATSTFSGYAVAIDQLGEDYLLDVKSIVVQDPKNPRWIAFAKTHKQKYGIYPAFLSQGIHDTLWLLKIAIEKAQSLEPQKLVKALKASTYNGTGSHPVGPFQECGYVKEGVMHVIKWSKGSPVWTNDIGIHRDIVCTITAKPHCYEEVVEILKGVK